MHAQFVTFFTSSKRTGLVHHTFDAILQLLASLIRAYLKTTFISLINIRVYEAPSLKEDLRDILRNTGRNIEHCLSRGSNSYRKCSHHVRYKSAQFRRCSRCMCYSFLCNRTSRHPIPASNCKYRIHTSPARRKP